jgi:hypothetical protein
MAPDYAHLDTQPVPSIPGQPPAPHVAHGVAATGIQDGPGRIVVDDEGYSFVYYAVLSADREIEGLTVVEVLAGEPRSARWTTGPAAQGAGGQSPVARPEAERIAAELLGFVLPDEAALHGMLGG